MKKIFAANWKLQKNPAETRQFFAEFKKIQTSKEIEVVFFPSSPCLEAAAQSVVDSQIKWGSQNCYFETKGAFTGETSAQVVKDLGGHYVLLGHSERRTLFHETDSEVSKKLKLVQSLSLIPMLCVGETLDQREGGKTKSVLEAQLTAGLSLADKTLPVVIAYEPVWAIGTGKVASVEQVRETHADVATILLKLGWSDQTPILYGGSVKADNSKELLSIPNVSGFLVGGASLVADSFAAICNS